MDGNGRWAQKRWLPRVAGHKQGVEALRRVVKACIERGVPVLSVFAFSSENWSRPVEEVSGLMDLLVMALSREVPSLRENIAQAAQRLVQQGREITEENLSSVMALGHVADPDLLIRTGGELRISNFLLWQSAYTELVFTECLWPDFDALELDRAMSEFASRERRFGQTSEQRAEVEPLAVAAGQQHA
jgi:undecaprenyl diphosphate synthase